MDEKKNPRAREKKVVSGGKGVEKKGDGLGTGPVNNTGSYEERKQENSQGFPSAGKPAQNSSFGQQRPQQGSGSSSGFPFGQGSHPRQGNNQLFGQGSRPQQGSTHSSGQGSRPQSGSFNPFGQSSRPQSGSFSSSANGNGQKQYNSAVKQNGNGGTQRSAGSGSGMGGGKLLLIVIALVVLFGGGKLGGLFGGDEGSGVENALNTITQQTGNGNNSATTQSNGLGGLADLLGSFMGSSTTSVYDLNSGSSELFSALTGSGGASGSLQSANQYFTTSSGDNSTGLDETVAGEAREKFTRILGGNRDEVTILVYMCGTDLESQQGMATSDLKEMANATIGEKINLIIYTGGCRRWRNDVISSSVNQIYQIKNGRFQCLEQDMGSASMVNPDTLAKFIEYGNSHFAANRMCLILWDHGGGSVSGYGYDEKVGHNQSMTLAGINNALKKANVKFDFIGFDACLMATVENGIMLSQYADYMIASEETEPGVGWYYTNWLSRLSSNTSMPTIQIGKMIADDFVAVCDRQCRGQATTLSVIDLAELQATIPTELKEFSIETNDLIQNKEYKTVSSARSKTREFAQQSKIDQIDLVDFAKNLGTKEGKSLVKALQSAVKYNKTGGSISHAYGLSIYFPYQRVNKVSQIVSTYQAIGMDEDYMRCIQEFASLEVSGQVSAGNSVSSYSSGQYGSTGLFGSLLGQGTGYSASYSQGGLEELLGGLYGGNSSGSTGSILDLFMGRTLTSEKAASYIMENHFDAGLLKWKDGKITLPDKQWEMVDSVVINVFLDDGSGFIDLGTDTTFTREGNSLLSDYDGTWLSIDKQPVAYYYLNTVEDGENYVIYGYVPAILNGERVDLLLNFDSERPYGYIAGAQKKYTDGESFTQAKGLIAIGKGDTLQFICDYYDYDENYRDSYHLGDPITLGDEVEIANTSVTEDMSKCKVTYRLTDIYQKNYWTPSVPYNK